MVVCIQPQNPDLVHVRGCGQSRSSGHRAGTVFHTRDCTGGSGHRVGTVSQTQDCTGRSGHRAETVPQTHDCTVGSRQSEILRIQGWSCLTYILGTLQEDPDTPDPPDTGDCTVGSGQSRSSGHRAGAVSQTQDCTGRSGHSGSSGHRAGTVFQTWELGVHRRIWIQCCEKSCLGP